MGKSMPPPASEHVPLQLLRLLGGLSPALVAPARAAPGLPRQVSAPESPLVQCPCQADRVHNHIKKRLEPRVRRSWSKSQRNEDIRPEMLQHCLANITQASRDFRSVGGLRSRTSKLSNSAHAPVEPASAQFCGIAAAALPNPLQSVDST